MSVARLFFCIAGIYASYLLWGLAQERLASPFARYPPHTTTTTTPLDAQHPDQVHTAAAGHDRFPSPAFITTVQALASCTSALVYLLVENRNAVRGSSGLLSLVGWREHKRTVNGKRESNGGGRHGHEATTNGTRLTQVQPTTTTTGWWQTLPALLARIAVCQTMGSPIGFMSLKYISYPTMVLAKSCKLIPVLVLNVLIYRRTFKPYKYWVVTLVSCGISMFMFFGDGGGKGKAKGGSNSLFGLALLAFNLLLDGLTASTQDELFALHPRFTGKQLMFTMSFLTLCLSLPVLLIPPSWPSIAIYYLSDRLNLPELLSLTGVPPHMQSTPSEPILVQCLHFLSTHPSAIMPLVQYALLGGLGQLFIFETISQFGSLTLVMVTVTRKLFTMMLSVFIFGHRLTLGQWGGIAVVFAAIGLEALVKRSEILNSRKKLPKPESKTL